MSDYFHEQMINKMLEPKERDFPCKECFIFKMEEERVNQFIANYKEQRMFLKNAEIIKALEDVRADVEKADFDFGDYYDHTETIKQWFGDLIDRKIKEIKE